MSKPRKLGTKSTYIPNAKADMRRNKKVYQQGILSQKYDGVCRANRKKGMK